MVTIKVCLGSSCFARGNNTTLAFLEKYVAEHKEAARLELVGCRCGNLCAQGPNIFINDRKYSNPSKADLVKILEAL